MTSNGSSNSHAQDRSVDSSMDTAPILRSLRVKSTLLEDLFFSLNQPDRRTDVALVMSYGPIIKVHKFVLSLCEEMRRKIQYAEDDHRKRMFDRQHLWIDLPKTLRLVPTVQVLFLLYLGKSVYCPGESVKDALTWFGISRVIKAPFEDQEFFEDPTCHPKGSLKFISKGRFDLFVVPYTMDGRDFLMDVEGNSRSARSIIPRNPSLIQLYCSKCGAVFTTNDEICAHDDDPTCPPKRSLKLISKGHPVLDCTSCGNLFTRLLRKSGNLSGSIIAGSAHCTDNDMIGEIICQRCLPVTSTPASYPSKYCLQCLLVFETEEDERQHDVECDNPIGKMLVENLCTNSCHIGNCGKNFLETSSINEGIYHHTEIVHGLPKQAYTFRLYPVCLVCGVPKGASNHSVESPGDFLQSVYQCYQTKRTKTKGNRNPSLARKPRIVFIKKELDTSIWYNRLEIQAPALKHKTTHSKSFNKNPENPVQSTSKQMQQPASPGPSNRRLRKRAETRDGSKAVGKEPDPGHPTKTDPKTVGKKGPASSSKKKPVKKS